MSFDSAEGDMAVLQTAVLLFDYFSVVNYHREIMKLNIFTVNASNTLITYCFQ